jgi:versiconal hemiacetal acetate esterase
MVGQYKESWLKVSPSPPDRVQLPHANPLQLEEVLGGRTALKGTAEEFRAQFDGLLGMLAPLYPPPTDAVSTKDGDVDGIAYRIYTPVAASKSGPLPVGLYTHGGGFVVGNLDAEDVLCRAIAEHAGVILVSVDYRLAPEHKAPAQLTDSLNVLKWVR